MSKRLKLRHTIPYQTLVFPPHDDDNPRYLLDSDGVLTRTYLYLQACHRHVGWVAKFLVGVVVHVMHLLMAIFIIFFRRFDMLTPLWANATPARHASDLARECL